MSAILANSNKVPGSYVRVSLGVGLQQGAGSRAILLLGNKLSAGAAANDTIIQRSTEEEVIAAVGQGSELHNLWLAAVRVDPNLDLYMGIVPESAGAQATGTIIASGPATSAGTIEIAHGSHFLTSVAVLSGDTATEIGDAIAAAINADPSLPFTAANAAGTVTLTARQAGPRGNDIRVRARQTEIAGGVALSGTLATVDTGALLAGGTTIDDPTNVLDAVGRRFAFIVSGYTTQTEVDEITDHATEQAEPSIGRRGRALFGAVDTLGTTTTLANANNDPRGQVFWHPSSPDTPGVIAATALASVASLIENDPASTLVNIGLPGLIEQWDDSAKPTGPELVAALNNGITPLVASDSGDVSISRSITMKSQDASGNPDYRVLDTHKVDVNDRIADEIQSNWGTFADGQKLGPHVDGQVPPPGVQTRVTVLEWALQLVSRRDNVWIENFATVTQAGAITNRNPVADGRVDIVLPTDVIEWLAQLTTDIRQIG